MGGSNNIVFYALAVIIGALIPIQAATNTAFSKAIGNPSVTGLMVFAVGFISVGAFVLITRTPIPSLSALTRAPLYGYAGGLIIATYVIMITIIAPRIGVGNAIGLVVTGQIICAIIIDHFGLFNTTVRSISLARLAGMIMMIIGIYLVMRKGTTA